MRTMVTGGAGFIGSHLVDELLRRGDDVHVLDNLSTGSRDNLDSGAELHFADIRDPDQVFELARPELVFHLAAQADVRISVDQPELDADINIIGTIRILEAARRHEAKVVFTSSGGAAYGECAHPAAESEAPAPLAPYGTSKVCGESYLATWNRLYGTQHVSLRLGNVYGPRQTPHGEAGVVAIFMGLLAASRRPTIFGDGSQTRDYVYVADVARAALFAAAKGGDIVNVGTGKETSVLDLYAAISAVTGVQIEPCFAPARLGELQRSVLDIGHAEREFDWIPRHALADGLEATWQWITSLDRVAEA